MFCYVVMAHTNAPQILHLVRRIKELSPDADVIVRHSVPDLVARSQVAAAGGRTYLSGIHVVWGDWSLTRAAMEVLEYARRTSKSASHFALISGQDYPIRDLGEWERQVAGADVDALIDVFPPHEEDYAYSWRMVAPPKHAPSLVRRGFHYGWWKIRGAFKRNLLFYAGVQDPRWYLGVRRSKPFPVPVTKGSLWMTLSAGGVDVIVQRDRMDSHLRRLFQTVRISDESYLQTMIAISPALRWIDCPTTHARFEVGEFGAQPVTDRELDYAALGPAAFIRKMVDLDPGLVAKADAMAARPAESVAPVAAMDPGQRKLAGAELYPHERDAMLARVPRWTPDTGIRTTR